VPKAAGTITVAKDAVFSGTTGDGGTVTLEMGGVSQSFTNGRATLFVKFSAAAHAHGPAFTQFRTEYIRYFA